MVLPIIQIATLRSKLRIGLATFKLGKYPNFRALFPAVWMDIPSLVFIKKLKQIVKGSFKLIR